MKPASELRLHCPAQPQYVAHIRQALTAFLEALQFDRAVRDDVTTAVGEALANLVEHAYPGRPDAAERDVQLLARLDGGGRLGVDVSDRGSFIRHEPLSGRGFGLRIIRAIAQQFQIDMMRGRCVSTGFDGPPFDQKR